MGYELLKKFNESDAGCWFLDAGFKK